MLNSLPARNDLLEWEKTDKGEAQITVMRIDSWKVRLLSKLFYVPRKRTITLDDVGTEIWQMCNGRTSVGQMIEQLRKKYKLDRKEAEVSLLQYLKTLGQKRFVGFVLEANSEDGRKKKNTNGGDASGKKWEK